MRKTKKIFAMLIVIAMLMSNLIALLSNVSMAVQSNVTVEIYTDNDHGTTLSEDGKTLTYTCTTDKQTYSFNLKQGDNNLVFTKHTGGNEQQGYYDYYVVEGISTNENVAITCPGINLGNLGVKYSNEFLGMWDNGGASEFFATNTLVNIDDVNHYTFRIESKEVDTGNPPPAINCNVNFGTASWNINGETVTASMQGKTLNNGAIVISNDDKITLTGYNPLTMEPIVRVIEDGYIARLLVDDNNQTWLRNTTFSIPWELDLEFLVRERTGLDEEFVNKEEPNTIATINLSSDSAYANSYQNAVIEINGYPINDEIEFGDKLPATNTAHFYYNAEENDGKVKFIFSSFFIEQYVGTIQINDTVFDVKEDILDYSNRTNWLNHYSHQMVSFDVDVPKASNDIYNVKVNVTEAEGRYQWIGNFLWTSDPKEEFVRDGEGNIEKDENGNSKVSDLYIPHAKLEVVKVVYEIDDKEVTVETKDLLKDKYIEYDPYNPVCSLVVPEGAMCTMKITPEYGYQVTSFGVNGQSIITGENVSEFTFPIFKGNFHLGAQVTQVADVVDAKSKKVKSGTIEIGKDEIDSGTVVLSVNDVELEKEKIQGFEKAAGDYTINNYLDIDLDQVIYKGTSSEVWSNKIHELEKEATIKLQLAKGVDGNNIIIVHNVNDGDKYEIIEIESYDEKTNTITFKTKSFSNYAIATKNTADSAEGKEKYTVNADNYTLTFSDDEGRTFTASIVELWNLSKEDLAKLEISEEEYEKGVKEVKEQLKDYGTILNVYAITVSDTASDYEHHGAVSIKIKMTDEMKKYNTFKLICIDEKDITKNDIGELKVEGDYLVGDLYHLSNYALVASNTQANNPKTGDNIIIYVTVFTVAAVGIFATTKLNKKKVTKKH